MKTTALESSRLRHASVSDGELLLHFLSIVGDHLALFFVAGELPYFGIGGQRINREQRQRTILVVLDNLEIRLDFASLQALLPRTRLNRLVVLEDALEPMLDRGHALIYHRVCQI